ncbi:MAG: 16S rRNA (guanine(527)-N(7))-methyltransferase RsmG [Bacteroidota bacterium]|nr:16S rRNA (guanine(527)-N(7))-methyltransferase RsmG [Bacteroidota bacterium]
MDKQDQYLQELTDFFRENGCSPDEYQLERLANYAALVVEKNQIVNLVSRKDVDAVVENHVFISAFISRFIQEKYQKFIDIGTGGGFPGIPFAILRPFIKGVLVDSTQKKINAVNEFINKLKLSNIKAESQRVEDPGFIEKYRSEFDLVLSRATVPLVMLLRYALPLIKDRSCIATIKGGDLQEEIKQAELKYRHYIKKLTVFELNYKPTNTRNEKEKKLIILEILK